MLSQLLRGTRGKLVELLRRNDSTVSGLATELDLTAPAVRMQLQKLERDGLVVPVGQQPTASKPKVVYGLTEQARELFPRAYDVVANMLVALLVEERGEEPARALLRQAGERLAHPHKPYRQEDDPVKRVERAAEVLRSIGGLPNLHRSNGTMEIVGHSCPLSRLVTQHSMFYDNAHTMLAELTALPVERACETDTPPPRCIFAFDLHA